MPADEAAMPMDEAIASARQANAAYLAGYERRLAAEIVAMLPEEDASVRRVLAVIDAIMNLTLTPQPSEPPP